MEGAWLFETVSFVGLLGFGIVILWLLVIVIRLRMEALVSRRVIASLQKVRPVAEGKGSGEKFALLVRQAIFGMVMLLVLLILYEVISRQG